MAGSGSGEFVLDATLAANWAAEDQRSLYAEDVLRKLQRSSAVAPCHWRLEVTNFVLNAQENGSLSASDAASFLSLLEGAPIAIDSGASGDWALNVRAIAARTGASAYEGAYLELCQRLALPLATEDIRLRNLAQAANVTVLSP